VSAVLRPEAVAIRPMGEDDIPAVLEVEQACYDFPWSDTIFSDCLRVGYCCWVLDDGEALCGHGIMSVAVEESHILNICVAPRARRQGHARTLMQHLLETACTHGARIAYLEVRPSNDAAIRLYQELGFRHVGTRRGYYPAHDGREDAFVLSTPLGPRVSRGPAS
jgi:ribosomal-protein-alanine N-acetyltransferase